MKKEKKNTSKFDLDEQIEKQYYLRK